MIPCSEALERVLAYDDDRIAESCRTLLLCHDDVRPKAVLLFHGLTASPAQFRRYAAELYARGHNVLVPRLPLHGYHDRLTAALSALTEDDLRGFALESYEAARALGHSVTVAGFSAGGTLALWLAQRAAFQRAVAIAPFFGAAGFPRFVMDIATTVMLRLRNRYIWWDPVRRERQLVEHGYPRYPTHALSRLYRIANEVVRGAGCKPAAHELVVVINRGEASVSNAQIRALVRGWRAVGASVEQIELRRMPPSHDVIEPARSVELADRVFPAILDAIDPR